MARRIKSRDLDTRAARLKLKPRKGKPYYQQIEPGLHLGYRRLSGSSGTWLIRHYIGNQTYEMERIGPADDHTDADGIAILNYWQAVEKARERMSVRARVAAGLEPLTVADAMQFYLRRLEDRGQAVNGDRSRYENHIKPALGDIEVAQLTTEQLREWLANIARADSKDKIRQRRASANRIWTCLRAALNLAWKEKSKQVPSKSEWERVESFKNVEVARVRYLNIAECKRLINACDPDFRLLVQAALQTGARYSELRRLAVADFNPDAGTVAIGRSKSGKARHVHLTDESVAFFAEVCAGRAGSEIMFKRDDGNPWRASNQERPMRGAVERAKITPGISFHGLRHTWASLAAMNGIPLMVVAHNLGHADTTMVVKHYGHLAPDYIKEAIRKGAPRFGFKPDKKIAVLT